MRSTKSLVPFATWGTVVKGKGLGDVFMRLDDGREYRVHIADLQFAKMGHPELKPL